MLDDSSSTAPVGSSDGVTSEPSTLTFAEFRRRNFSSLEFRASDAKRAGRILKERGEAAAIAFLDGKGEVAPYDVKPPVKCHILDQSRPISEWAISQVDSEVQRKVFAMRIDEFELIEMYKPTRECLAYTLHRLGMDAQSLHVQAWNKLIPRALATYRGVLTKVENLNVKKAKRAQKTNERRIAEGLEPEALPKAKAATDAEGYLLEPPGVNPCFLGYQQIAPQPILNTLKLAGVSERFAGYERDPDAPIKRPYVDRRSIPVGQPGHVPDWQVPHLNPAKNRRVRLWYCHQNNRPKPNRRPESAERVHAREQARNEGALLCLIKCRQDWLLFDARSLYRNAYYRGLVTKDTSLRQLLGMFSGDATVDPVRGIVTLCYKQGIVPIRKRRTTSTKKAPELLEKLTAAHGTIGLVSVDLGQTNPIAARVSKLDTTKRPELVCTLALPQVLRGEWARYRTACDSLEATIKTEALAALPLEQRAEMTRVYSYAPDEGRRDVLETFGVDIWTLPSSEMSSGTYFVADEVLRTRPEDHDLVHFNNPKKGLLKRTDHNVYRFVRPRASVETKEAYQQALWKLKRESPTYRKLSQRKLELARRCCNWLVRETRRLTQCDDVVIICEDLNVGMFHGRGKRDVGWDQFFVPKRENRWFIQALHKSLTDLAAHQGVPVAEVNPARTSITCPACRLCDAKSRDGEAFCCVGCGTKFHADFDVAAFNLEAVALTGKTLPKRERSSTPQEPRGARSRRTPRRTRKKSAKDEPGHD